MNANLIKLFIPTIVTMQLITGLIIAMPSATDTPLPQEGMPIQTAPVNQQEQTSTLSWPPPGGQPQQNTLPVAQPLLPQTGQQSTSPRGQEASTPAFPVKAVAQPGQQQQVSLPPQSKQTVPLGELQQAGQPAASPQVNPALFKELDAALQGIEQAKRELGKLLQDLDGKLLAARKQAAEAKTLTYNLLNKEQEQEAKSDFEKIRNTNREFQATQKFVQNEFSKNFNDKVTELRINATQAEAALKAIKAAKPAEAAKPVVQAITPLPNTQPGNAAAQIDATNASAVGPSGGFDLMTSGIASMISGIKNFFGSNNAAKKKKVAAAQTHEPMPTNATERSREASTMVEQMDKGLQAIDATRTTIQQYIQTINKSTQYIEGLAKENPATAQLLTQSKKAPIQVEESQLKQTILLVVGKTFDGISYMTSGVYSLLDNTIGRFTRTLIKDVDAKIAAQETLKSTPGAA
jgi:hypothetical protein